MAKTKLLIRKALATLIAIALAMALAIPAVIEAVTAIVTAIVTATGLMLEAWTEKPILGAIQLLIETDGM